MSEVEFSFAKSRCYYLHHCPANEHRKSSAHFVENISASKKRTAYLGVLPHTLTVNLGPLHCLWMIQNTCFFRIQITTLGVDIQSRIIVCFPCDRYTLRHHRKCWSFISISGWHSNDINDLVISCGSSHTGTHQHHECKKHVKLYIQQLTMTRTHQSYYTTLFNSLVDG